MSSESETASEMLAYSSVGGDLGSSEEGVVRNESSSGAVDFGLDEQSSGAVAGIGVEKSDGLRRDVGGVPADEVSHGHGMDSLQRRRTLDSFLATLFSRSVAADTVPSSRGVSVCSVADVDAPFLMKEPSEFELQATRAETTLSMVKVVAKTTCAPVARESSTGSVTPTPLKITERRRQNLLNSHRC
jgi:hypothetical protein